MPPSHHSQKKLKLAFFHEGREVKPATDPHTRNTRRQELPQTTVYTLTAQFDCIQVNTLSGTGLAIPTFPSKGDSNAVSVAVDLGTSNTHIELMMNDKTRNIQTFEYLAADAMQGLLFRPRTVSIAGKEREIGLKQARTIIADDTLPERLTAASTYHFPSRTALSFAQDIDWNAPAGPLELSNVCLSYGKLPPLDYDRYDTNLKWGADPDAQKRVNCYIENLLLLIRGKVLAAGGDLSQTKLTWFYPMSMTTAQCNSFRQQWTTVFHQLFGPTAQINDLSESLAPVCFHLNNNADANDMVTIDIGGGTTDIAFAEDKHVKCVTSFRFAANALFEDSITTTRSDNGIVDHFKPEYLKLFNSKCPEVAAVINNIDSGMGNVSTGNTSANLANLFFTITDVPGVKESGIKESSLDFVNLLRGDSQFKLEFIIFYAAIIFHTGRVIAAKNLRLPQHIAFSGNGSNVIKVLATADSAGRKELAKFTKLLLETSSGKTYAEGDRLTILGFDANSTPKIATCKGGLLSTVSNKEQDDEPECVVLSHGTNILTNADTYDRVGDSLNAATLGEVELFFRMLKDVGQHYDFTDKFGIERDSWKLIDDLLKSKTNLTNFLSNGIERRRGRDGAQPVAETFFFYPIAAMLQAYAQARYEQLTEQGSDD